MAGFDDLIRKALEKQGNPTAERRAAIYASSRQALDRMLASNTTLDENAVALQRQRLEQAIVSIEASYATPPQTAPPPPQQPAAPAKPAGPAPAPAPRLNVQPAAPEIKQVPSAQLSVPVDPGTNVPPVPAPPAAQMQSVRNDSGY